MLARHGETNDNLEPLRFQGFTDTPLNDTGRAQAHALAARLAAGLPLGCSAPAGLRSLWTSDLSRAPRDGRDRRCPARAAPTTRRASARGQPWSLGGLHVRRDRARRARALRSLARGARAVALPGRRVTARAAAARHGGADRDPRRRRATGARRLPWRQHPRDAVRLRSARARRVSRLRCPQRGGGTAVRRLPVAAFVALAIATIAAFFVTQHLKVTTPLLDGRRRRRTRPRSTRSTVAPA